MLPSSKRVHKSLFKKIFSKGRFYSGQNINFVVLKSPLDAQNTSKFAFSVSKNVSKTAVSRNRLRRRGYAAIENLLSQIKPGFLGVFVYKKGGLKDLKPGVYIEEIGSLLEKSGILNSK